MRTTLSVSLQLLAPLGLLLHGCAAGGQSAATSGTHPAGSSSEGADRRDDDGGGLFGQGQTQLGQSRDAASVAAAIEVLERALQEQPGRSRVTLALARANHLAGRFRVFDGGTGAIGQARTHFERGERHAATLLDAQSTDPAQASELELQALYWRARNQLERARLDGYASLVAIGDGAAATLAQCGARNPDYDHSGVDRFLGALRADPPAAAYRDLTSARDHFERAIERSPTYLATRVDYAATYAVAAQQRDLFDRELTAVLSAPLGGREVAPDNALAQRRAEALLARAAELFE